MKRVLISLTLVFALVVGLQLAEPVSAVKWTKIDQVVKYHPDSQYGDIKIVYKVYKKTSYRVYIKALVYEKKTGSTKYTYQQTWKTYLTKITKTKLRIKDSAIEGGYVKTYKKTKKSATWYYWHVYKPKYINY